jgi:hypothetical protein
MQLSQKDSPNWEKGDRPVFHAAQSALLSITGHAEYYRDRILKAESDMEAEWNKDRFFSIKYAHFSNERTLVFGTLKHLPSPETVRVLGELLSYEWVPPNNATADDEHRQPPLSHFALRTMCSLPLIGKPTTLGGQYIDPADVEKDLPAWRNWYEQIKSGNRTFRFEGDPTEYDLNGPAPKVKLERIAMHQRMESDREARREGRAGSGKDADSAAADAPVSRKPATYAIIAAVLALLVSIVWHFRRAKSAK